MKLSVVSYLGPESTALVRELQRTLSEITGSHASLTSWEPHITVGDGVDVNEEGLLELQTSMQDIADSTVPFELKLEGIGTLDNWHGGEGEEVTPYVIYLNVSVTDKLTELVRLIATASTEYDTWYHMPEPYLPHCTLAFRDLSKEGFEKGIAYLDTQNIALSATIDHIALVEKLPNLDTELTRYEFLG